jgi:ribonuclease BN (tRNA processing enzyme)
MNVTLLGTGTPTNPHRFQSAVLVEIGSNKLLFDAGRGTVHQLYQAGVEINHVNPVFITHHHFDHINDLFDVIISTAMRGRDEELQIYGPSGTEKIVSALLEGVYASDIRFRIEEDKGIRRMGGCWAERPESITRVDVIDIEPGLSAETESWKVYADYVLHGDFAHVPDFMWRCLGYRIEAEGAVVAISGDTVLCDGIISLAKDADLLVQCCHLPKSRVTNPVMRYLTTSIVPSSGQVGAIAAQAGAKRMVIIHLSESISTENIAEIFADIRCDYRGEVLFGQDLMTIEV